MVSVCRGLQQNNPMTWSSTTPYSSPLHAWFVALCLKWSFILRQDSYCPIILIIILQCHCRECVVSQMNPFNLQSSNISQRCSHCGAAPVFVSKNRFLSLHSCGSKYRAKQEKKVVVTEQNQNSSLGWIFPLNPGQECGLHQHYKTLLRARPLVASDGTAPAALLTS